MASTITDKTYKKYELYHYTIGDIHDPSTTTITPLYNNIQQWMIDAHTQYNIPLSNLKSAYSEWSNVMYTFIDNDGKRGSLVGNGQSYITLNIRFSECNKIEFVSDLKRLNMALYGTTSSNGVIQYTDGNMWLNWNTNIGAFPTTDRATTILTPSSFTINAQTKTHSKDYRSDTNFLMLFKSNGQSSVSTNKVYYVRINDHSFLVPFYRDSVYGMLDLMSMDFYKNTGSGAFTYQFA